MPTLNELIAGLGLTEGIIIMLTTLVIVFFNDAARIKRKLQRKK